MILKKKFFTKILMFFLQFVKSIECFKIEYFLFHNAKDMLSNKNKKIIEHLNKLKNNKKIKYLGVLCTQVMIYLKF